MVVCEKKLIKNQIKKCRKLATQAFIRADSKKSINRAKLVKLTGKGSLQRIEREPTAATASLVVPKATVSLLSALRFHDLTTRIPFEVWMAIAPHAHRPKAARVELKALKITRSKALQ